MESRKERQSGWYWVKINGSSAIATYWAETKTWDYLGAENYKDYDFDAIGSRIPMPDEEGVMSGEEAVNELAKYYAFRSVHSEKFIKLLFSTGILQEYEITLKKKTV